MIEHRIVTDHIHVTIPKDLAQSAWCEYVALGLPVHALPAADDSSWILLLPVEGKFGAVTMPIGLARSVQDRLTRAPAPVVQHPITRRATILVDARHPVEEHIVRALQRAGICLAPPGSRVVLPVPHSDLPFSWMHPPTSKPLPLLATIVDLLKILGAIPLCFSPSWRKS
ncbi:hypothetical protein [Nocardia sp. NPDC052566]|uniref:hypothetical protein n=1 Tax=Nocardia sp. NPDC052566 TaxID=3364330 RepID=UPI0037C868DD